MFLIEKMNNERFVFFQRNLVESDEGGAGVKRFAGIGENVGHNVFFTSAEDEGNVLCLLYISTQQCLHILFRIFPYLLELVYGHHDGCVLAVQKLEQPAQGVFFFVGCLIGNLQ